MIRNILTTICQRFSMIVGMASLIVIGYNLHPDPTPISFERFGHVSTDINAVQVIWMMSDGSCEYAQGHNVWKIQGCYIPDL